MSAQDLGGLNDLSQEEQVASAALISGLALILIILGIVALVVIIVLVAATTTGVLVYKKRMFDVSAHAFEGEIVSNASVPVGAEIAAPSWALEAGGSGVNPLGNRNAGQLEMQSLSAQDGNSGTFGGFASDRNGI